MLGQILDIATGILDIGSQCVNKQFLKFQISLSDTFFNLIYLIFMEQ